MTDYVAPTSKDFQTRFSPVFDSVDSGKISYALGRAAKVTSVRWSDNDDRREATFLYTAHLLILDGEGASMEAETFRAGTAGVQSMSSASLSISKFTRGPGATDTGADATSYGQRYLDLVGQLGPVGGPILLNGC